MEELDLVVIGAGWFGLAAAKQYLGLHPGTKLAILDNSPTIGGVWSSHRQFPGLKSNNLHGTYQYPDFPMDPAKFDCKPNKYIPAATIQNYLITYAKEFGIYDSVRLQTNVISCTHKGDEASGWVLKTVKVTEEGEVADGAKETEVFAKRLIIATGLTSQPVLPHILGQEEFGKPLFHGKDFAKRFSDIEEGKVKRVTVMGASKTAYDAVYAYGTRGVKVDWVIRASGHGPTWMSPSIVTPLKQWIEELANMRFLGWFSPCVWSVDGGYQGIRKFWMQTAVGRAITSAFWGILGADVITLSGYDKHPETKKLKPWKQAFFMSTSTGIFNYDTDVLELVRNGTVNVHIADIDHLSPGKVHLADEANTVLESDTLFCSTGWKHVPQMKFYPEGIEREMGIPHIIPAHEDKDAEDKKWAELIANADAKLEKDYPILTNVPPFNKDFKPISEVKAIQVTTPDAPISPQHLSTYMLYHFTVPATSRFLRTKDLAFAGVLRNFSTAISAHIQALWISAYFDGKLARDPSAAVTVMEAPDDIDAPPKASSFGEKELTLNEVQWQAALYNRFGKWRYPGDFGMYYPDFVFEAVPALDLLLTDLGLERHRKKGWLSEAMSPYGPLDYAGVVDEWKAKYGTD